MSDLNERSDTLEKRLHDGFLRIGEALNDHIDVTNWEVRWIELLREYEGVQDALAALKPEQVGMELGVAPAEREVA
jgi:hypothetical protein